MPTKRLGAVAATLVVTGGLSATLTGCGGSGSSGDTPQAGRSTTTSSGPADSSPSSRSGQGGTAAELPAGFPLPKGAQPQGSAMTGDTVTLADYTVPDGKKAYDELVAALPGAGWAISAGTWNGDLGSGTITAAGQGSELKLIILDTALSLSITKS